MDAAHSGRRLKAPRCQYNMLFSSLQSSKMAKFFLFFHQFSHYYIYLPKIVIHNTPKKVSPAVHDSHCRAYFF